MASGNDVDVRFGADTSDAEAGLDRFSGSLTGSITAGVALGETLQNVVAEAFRILIQQMEDAATLVARQAEEMEKFAFRLGTTTEEATGLREALEEVGVTTDAYEGILMRLSRQVKTNEESLNKMGVVTRDGNGHLVDQNTLLQNALRTMLEYKAGTDRNQASLYLFGRTAADVSGLIRLTTESIAEASAGAKELQQEITQNDIEAFHAYQKALANVGDAFEGMKLVMSRDILPLLTELMNFISSRGVDGLSLFGRWWRWLSDEADKASFTFTQVRERINGAIEGITKNLANLAKAKNEFADSHWIDAFNTATSGAKNMEAAMAAADKRIESARIAMEASIALRAQGAFGPGTVEHEGADSTPGGKGSRDFVDPKSARGGAGKQEDLMSTFRQQLQEMRDSAGLFRSLELSEEVKFWEEKADLVRGMPKIEDKVNHELAATRRKMAAEELTSALKTLDEQKELYADNKEEIVRIEKAKQALIGATHGEASNQYKDRTRDVTRAEREEAQERVRIAEQEILQKKSLRLAEISDEEAQLTFMRSIGAINGEEEVAQRRKIEAEKYNAAREAIIAQRDLANQTEDAQRKLNLDLELMEFDHNNRIKEIDRQAAQERAVTWSTFMDPIQSAFSTSIDAIIRGTTTLTQAFRNMAQNILLSFVDLGIRMVFEWIKRQVVLTTVSAQGAAARTAIEEESASAGLLAHMAAALSAIHVSASQAAAGAFAWVMEEVPWPYSVVLAPVAAAGAYAGTMAFGAFSGAEGGWWDVPGNQATLLHNREMVLPADIAESLRNLVGSGSQSSQLGGGMTVNIHAVDAQSVRKLFMREGAGIMSAVKSQVRNFNTRTAY